MIPKENKNALKWRCRRGMQEMDILLLRYLNTKYDQAPVQQQVAFAVLLKQQDDILWDWLSGRSIPSEPDLQSVVSACLAN